MDGVVATTAGWIGDVEVVGVEYDARRLDYAHLVRHAVDRECALRVFPKDEEQREVALEFVAADVLQDPAPIRRVRDQKEYLARTALRFVPLTRTQAARIHADVSRAEEWLSPRQARILAAVQAEPDGWTDCIDRDLAEVWDAAWARTLAIESR